MRRLDSLNRLNFMGWNRQGSHTIAHDTDDAWRGDNLAEHVRGQAAEYVPGKQRSLDDLDAVGPLTTFAVARKEHLVSPLAEVLGAEVLAAAPDLNCEPLTHQGIVATRWDLCHGRSHMKRYSGRIEGCRPRQDLMEDPLRPGQSVEHSPTGTHDMSTARNPTVGHPRHVSASHRRDPLDLTDDRRDRRYVPDGDQSVHRD